MSDRIRLYPYRVTYINLQDYSIFTHLSVPRPLPVFTEIIKAKNSEDAKNILRGSISGSIAFLSAGRYPERLGTSVRGVKLDLPTEKQLRVLEKNGILKRAKSSRGPVIPPAIDPKVFVASKPNSTLYHRPVPSPASPMGAPRTLAKSTPLQLSNKPIDIGGFTVGFRKPGEVVPPSPTTAKPTPQPDIYASGPGARQMSLGPYCARNPAFAALPDGGIQVFRSDLPSVVDTTTGTIDPVARPSGYYLVPQPPITETHTGDIKDTAATGTFKDDPNFFFPPVSQNTEVPKRPFPLTVIYLVVGIVMIIVGILFTCR